MSLDHPSSAAGEGGFSFGHASLIATFFARFAVRTGGGLVFLLFLLIAGLSVAGAFIAPVEAMMETQKIEEQTGMTTGELTDEILKSEQVTSLVQGVTDASDDEVTYFIHDNPALLSAILLVLLMVIPFTTCLGAFNQTAGDIGTRGLRYLLLRTERVNIFFGRFAGTVLFACISTIFLVALVILYVQFKLKAYPAADLWVWGIQGFVALTLLSIPYVALCAWISGILDSPFASLSLSLLISGFPILFFRMAHFAAKGAGDGEGLPWLPRLMPWGWKYELLSVDMGTRLIASGMMLVFTVLFLWLGHRSFQKRDL